jgi:hypothetical protein
MNFVDPIWISNRLWDRIGFPVSVTYAIGGTEILLVDFILSKCVPRHKILDLNSILPRLSGFPELRFQ